MRIFTLLAACLLITACQEQVLHSKLSESEANEMLAVLYANGVDASKLEDKDGTFRVDTGKSGFTKAVSVLQLHGLPRERFQSLGQVFEKDGFVSSPLEERARLNYALSQEIAHTITNIDGVVLARVHLAVPKKEHLSDSAAPSSASVFVKHRPDVDLTPSIPKIKSLVVTGFENLPYDNVTVGLFPAENVLSNMLQTQPLAIQKASMQIEKSSITNLILPIIGLLLLVAGLIVALMIPNSRKNR